MDQRTALLDASIREPENTAARLVFADWLEESGDPLFARYIRVRCALDGRAPEPGTYPDLIEEHREADAGRREPTFQIPKGFSTGCWWSGDSEEWWSDSGDAMEGGLLSFVEVENDDNPETFVHRLGQLLEATPVRGIDFQEYLAENMAAIFRSPIARKLKRLAFVNRHDRADDASLAIQALVDSPLVQTLERLELGGGPYGTLTNADARALAKAPFKHLQRLDVPFSDCRADRLHELMTASWFRDLQHLCIGVNEACAEACGKLLGGMKSLHTLNLWMPPDSTTAALAGSELPELRRLFIHCGNLMGEHGKGLGAIRAPQLIELWLRNCSAGEEDLATLAQTRLFDDLRVLSFDGTNVSNPVLEAIAARPCAAKLRTLRIYAPDEDSNIAALAHSPFARPGSFPALTTLALRKPYGKKVKSGDMAEFLEKAATSNLRHLTLQGCGLDEACLTAIATRPTFMRLTRLILGCMDSRGNELSILPAAAKRLFESKNLQNLVELKLEWCKLGDGARVLVDPGVLSNLRACTLHGVPARLAETLKKARPVIHCL